MANNYYKLNCEDLCRIKHPNEFGNQGEDESNFKLENPSFDNLIGHVKEKLGIKVNKDYFDKIIPDYIILERRDGQLYEILTDALVVKQENYFDGVGLFYRDNQLVKATTNDLISFKNSLNNDDIACVTKRLLKFVFKANNTQNYLSILDVEFRKFNDQDVQLGGEYLRKIFKK